MPGNIKRADSTINNHYLEAYKHSNHYTKKNYGTKV
jgi:hypothetical protein